MSKYCVIIRTKDTWFVKGYLMQTMMDTFNQDEYLNRTVINSKLNGYLD